MQNTPRERLQQFAHVLQQHLFVRLEEETGPLSDKGRLLVAVLSAVPLTRLVPASGGWMGRPAKDRLALAAAFIAKAVYGIESTRRTIEQLRQDRQLRCICGWDSIAKIPHESTFSRAFDEFSRSELPQHLHEAVIRQTQQGRIIGHIARDATAIEARETFPESKAQKKKRQYQRRPKRAKACERGTRLERQRKQTLAQQVAALPQQCGIGTKKSSKGHQQYWRGYKLHLDVADGQIPISALLTAASVHDSQAAIPLMTMSTQRVTYLYELMDSAYDARAIREHSLQLGHQPITDHPKRRRKIAERKVPLRKNSRSWKRVIDTATRAEEMTWAEQDRFAERTMVERVFSRLKDEFGARLIRVRGARKIMTHLMFGVLALTVDQLLKLTG
jgi:transposase